MKHYFSLIFCCLLVICVAFSGCTEPPSGDGDSSPGENSSQMSSTGNDSPVVKILVDLDCTRYGSGEVGYNAMTELLYWIKANNGPKIEIEYVPHTGTERDSKITALQTQIMAGEGPDLYIVACSSPESISIRKHPENPFLFPYVQSIMRRNLFLPLDDYIESARFMEWDKLTPAVMEAGRTEQGQMVLPMTYDFEATVFNRSDISFYDSLPLTWDEIFPSRDLALWVAGSYNDTKFGDALGKLADYDTLKLSFSEEDLARVAYETCYLLGQNITGGFSEAPPHLSYLFSRHNGRALSSVSPPGLLAEEEPAIVPLYNLQGGVTANVTSFVAIDANTDCPEEAFFIADLLLSKKVQQSSFFSCVDGVPMHEDLLQVTDKVSLVKDDPDPWFFSDAGYAEYCRVRSEINAVKFYSPLDVTLTEMYDVIFTGRIVSQEEIAEIAAETYRVLQMMLDES